MTKKELNKTASGISSAVSEHLKGYPGMSVLSVQALSASEGKTVLKGKTTLNSGPRYTRNIKF